MFKNTRTLRHLNKAISRVLFSVGSRNPKDTDMYLGAGFEISHLYLDDFVDLNRNHPPREIAARALLQIIGDSARGWGRTSPITAVCSEAFYKVAFRIWPNSNSGDFAEAIAISIREAALCSEGLEVLMQSGGEHAEDLRELASLYEQRRHAA